MTKKTYRYLRVGERIESTDYKDLKDNNRHREEPENRTATSVRAVAVIVQPEDSTHVTADSNWNYIRYVGPVCEHCNKA